LSYRIRRLSAADAALLSDVAPDVFDGPVDPTRLAGYLGTPGHLMIIALDGDLVVGQCAAVIHHHPDKPTELYVDEVGTASTHRRQGIARKLLSAMLEWGRELGCEEAWLGTELDNEEANALYRSFSPAERETMMMYAFVL
jgi:aminoglycoside 6'-N-acetyltransferase I